MAQRHVKQVRDVTSTVAGTVLWPATGSAKSESYSAILVLVEVLTAASGALSISVERDDGSTAVIFDVTGIAVGSYWGLSIGQDTSMVTADNGVIRLPVPGKVKVSATAGAGGTVRLTVWGIQITG